jgi:hypothetical protein
MRVGARPAAHVLFGFGLEAKVTPTSGEFGVAARLPGVVFLGEPVGRLTAESRLGGEDPNPRPDLGQLLVGGHEVAVGLGEPGRRVLDERQRAQPARALPLLKPQTGQGLAGLFD